MDDLDINISPVASHQYSCTNCNEPISAESRFCSHCGQAITVAGEETSEEKWSAIKQAGLFFLIHAVACCVFSFIDYFRTLSWSVFFDATLAAVAVIFFAINWSRLKSQLVWHNFSLLKLVGYCVIAVVASLVVGYIVDWLNISLFRTKFSYYSFYAGHHNEVALAIFFVSVMPALFEELGYRGFLLGKLLPITDKKQAIFISSFVFAIMHRSFISLFWLIPFALWLGHIRVKENTLWYGICIHFCFNFTTVILEIMQSAHGH